MTRTPETRLATLNRASVARHFDAYEDVPWEDPSFALEPTDPRHELSVHDPLGASDWYRAQEPALRAQIGLHLTCERLRRGIDFEGILSGGLLQLASTLEPSDPRYRYALHEVIEEGQHSLMFREMIVRAGLPTRGLIGIDRWSSRGVPKLGRTFPELFFFFVLGGEAPIDHVQRLALREEEDLHPMIASIIRIHVMEEARHISFADIWLRERIPRLPAWRRAFLAVRIPFLLGEMARQMFEPPRWLARHYGIPKTAYRNGVLAELKIAALTRVRRLCEDVGLMGPVSARLWRLMGIAPNPSPLLPART